MPTFFVDAKPLNLLSLSVPARLGRPAAPAAGVPNFVAKVTNSGKLTARVSHPGSRESG